MCGGCRFDIRYETLYIELEFLVFVGKEQLNVKENNSKRKGKRKDLSSPLNCRIRGNRKSARHISPLQTLSSI
jgi:hypothetical protein